MEQADLIIRVKPGTLVKGKRVGYLGIPVAIAILDALRHLS